MRGARARGAVVAVCEYKDLAISIQSCSVIRAIIIVIEEEIPHRFTNVLVSGCTCYVPGAMYQEDSVTVIHCAIYIMTAAMMLLVVFFLVCNFCGNGYNQKYLKTCSGWYCLSIVTHGSS